MFDNESVLQGLQDKLQLHVYQCYCERQIIAAIVGIASLCGIFGNTLVLLSVILSRKLRTITNVFVLNMSIADLIPSMIIPFQIVAILSDEGYLLSDSICVIIAFTFVTCLGASVNTLTCIAVNRLLLVTRSPS